MQNPFPPGDISKKSSSNWRNFEFMLHQVQSVISPDISLQETVHNWHQITLGLAENTRSRKSRLERKSTEYSL